VRRVRTYGISTRSVGPTLANADISNANSLVRFMFKGDSEMLRLAVGCLILALIAGLFGFGFIESTFMQGAQILFCVFLVIALITFMGGTFGRRYRQ
jgi:uncharacterized membrane protein YtjA (UPF0391 family)